MTVIAMGLGYAISIGDPTILSANLQVVSGGLRPPVAHERIEKLPSGNLAHRLKRTPAADRRNLGSSSYDDPNERQPLDEHNQHVGP